MSVVARSLVTAVLTVAVGIVSITPAQAEVPETGLLLGEVTEVALPDGGTADFFVTDPGTSGADVEVAPVETVGATAITSDGTVTAIGDGVSVVATNTQGEDVSSFEHEMTVVPATAETPEYVTDFVPGVELVFPISEEQLAGLDAGSLGVWSRETSEDEWEWVPSAYDAERGAVVANSDHLSEFTVMAAPAAPATNLPRIALDPDDNLGLARWNGNTLGELQYNYAVAVAVETLLEEQCQADVLITRNANTPFVSRTIRANRVQAHDADIALTLAFNVNNTVPGQNYATPWGWSGDGGVVAWSSNTSASRAFGNRFLSNIPEYTGRPSRRALNPNSNVLPYSEFNGKADVYAHAELLFLDHNYDYPVIKNHLDWVVNGVVASLVEQIAAMPSIECQEPVTLPEPPTQAEIDQVNALGQNNYNIYGTDPVNLSTGNFLSSEEVFTLTGVGDQTIGLGLAYNALDGRISQVGQGWNFAYSSRVQQYADGSIMAVLADGRSVYFESDGNGGYVSPPAALTRMTAITGGVRIGFADRTSLDFAIDEETGAGVLVGAIDRQGNATVLTYGPLAEVAEGEIAFAPLTSITDEAGQTVAVQSTPEGRITGFTHPDGRQWTLSYDATSHLTAITDGAGRTRSFGYNAEGLLNVVTGADGVAEVTNVFDTENRVVTQTDGMGYVREIAYEANNVTRLTDALGNESTLAHNEKNQLTAAYDAEGGVTRTLYDVSFNPITSVDANGNAFNTEYDSMGRATKYTNPVGEVTEYTYNAIGDMTSVTTLDASGTAVTTTFVLNADGRTVQTVYPDGTSTFATYDDHGDMLTYTDALGNTSTMAYDSRGNAVLTADALGNTMASTFDLANRLTSVTDANGGTATFVWTAADTIVSITDALGGVTAFTHDVNDSLLSETDALGNTTTYEYNTNLQMVASVLPDGSRTEYTFDAEHRMVGSLNADGTTQSWEYDALGREISNTDEAGNVWLTEYDAIGNVIGAVAPTGDRTTMEYDAMARAVAIVDALGNRSTISYNALGTAASATDALGRTTTYEYDTMGRLVTVVQPDGSTLRTSFDAAGRLLSKVDANGHTTTIGYDAGNRPVSYTDAMGEVWTTEFDANGNAVATVDPRGARATMQFDALNRPVLLTDPMGGEVAYAYDAMGRVVSETGERAGVTGFTYDALGQLLSATSPDGTSTTYGYNVMGSMTSVVNPLGDTRTYEYDARQLQTAATDEAGFRWETEYDARGYAVASIDPTGARSTTVRDAIGRAVSSENALGATTSAAFDAAGQLVSSTNELGAVTTLTYDSMGRLKTTASAEGNVKTYTHDANGNIVAVTNALGDVISTEYDALNRVVAQVMPDGGRTETAYDTASNVVGVTGVNGGTQSLTFDLLGRITTATDAAGFTTVNTYDASGNVLTSTDAKGFASSYTYDVMNRRTSMTDALGHTSSSTFDALGQPVFSTDEAGVVTAYTHDARGLLTATTENYVAGANASASVNVTTSTTYDARGLATSVTDANGNTVAYVYDALGRMVSETDALGQSVTTEYNAADLATAVTAGDASVTAYQYDLDNRLAAVVYPDQTVTYTRDLLGRVTSSTDAVGTTSTVFDWAGRTLQETDAQGNTVTRAFDLAGNTLSTSYADGRVIERTFDVRNQAVTQSDAEGVTSFAYDELGLLTTVNRASGVVSTMERDALRRVTNIVHTGLGVATGNPLPSGEVNPSSAAPGNAFGHCKDNGNGHPNQQPAGCDTEVLAFAYEYDARDLVVGRDVVTDETVTATDYVHDDLGRLVRSTTSGVVSEYGWDAAANLVFETVSDDLSTNKKNDAYTITRTVNAANQLVQSVMDPKMMPAAHTETTTYSYDARGNRVGEVLSTVAGKKTKVSSEVSFEYDFRDQLTRKNDDGVVTEWVRDGMGRALSVTEDGDTRERLFDGVTMVADGDTALTLSPAGGVLTETNADGTVDVLTDLLGSTVGTASDGVISADLALFGDFGDLLTEPETETVTGFTGHSTVAGELEFYARSYDVTSRVWLQDDIYRGTVTRASSLNRYTYVEGAPETFVDVLGYYRAAAALRAQQLAAAKAAWIASNEAAQAQAKAQACATYYGCRFVPTPADIKRSQEAYRAFLYNAARSQMTPDELRAHQERKRQEAAQARAEWVIAQQQAEVEAAAAAAEAARPKSLWERATSVATSVVQGVQSFASTVASTASMMAQGMSPMEWVHMGLDVIGMIPVFGEVADLLNAGLYAIEGDYVNAALSMAAMIPIAGAAIAGTKIAVKITAKVVDAVQASVALSRAVDVATTVTAAVARQADRLPGGTSTTAARSADDVADAGTSGVTGVTRAGDNTPTNTTTRQPDTEVCLLSFSADTEVVMADGSTKKISELEIGDMVLAEDPETGEKGAREVTHLWIHGDQLVDLLVDGDTVTTTEDHPFWNETDQAWQEAQELDEGDMLLTADGDLVRVDGIDWDTTRTGTAYNLTVDDLHTYFVATGDAAVLVHNCGTTVYRGMSEAADGTPVVGGGSASKLGAREGTDIIPDADGIVHPGTKGVSANTTTESIPEFRKPPEFEGTNPNVTMYCVDVCDLPPDLRFVPDGTGSGHGFIEPVAPMSIDAYQEAVASTAESWTKATP